MANCLGGVSTIGSTKKSLDGLVALGNAEYSEIFDAPAAVIHMLPDAAFSQLQH